jgi:hypothetical protein
VHRLVRVVIWIGVTFVALALPGKVLLMYLPALTGLGPGFSTLSVLVLFCAFLIAVATATLLAIPLLILDGAKFANDEGGVHSLLLLTGGSVLTVLGYYRIFLWAPMTAGNIIEDFERRWVTLIFAIAMLIGGLVIAAAGLLGSIGHAWSSTAAE